MENKELIEKCKNVINGEDEPDSMHWLDMVEGLCDALEKTDKNLKVALRALENAGCGCSAVL